MRTKTPTLFTGMAAILLTTGSAIGVAGPAITIYKNPNCGCCQSWAAHLDANGFETTTVETDNLTKIKQQHDVPRDMTSCHTALIGDLVIEGHVPASDIVAYLENPQAGTIGLSVPGMPHGAPGMETGRKDDFQVIIFSDDGEQDIFHAYQGN